MLVANQRFLCLIGSAGTQRTVLRRLEDVSRLDGEEGL